MSNVQTGSQQGWDPGEMTLFLSCFFLCFSLLCAALGRDRTDDRCGNDRQDARAAGSWQNLGVDSKVGRLRIGSIGVKVSSVGRDEMDC